VVAVTECESEEELSKRLSPGVLAGYDRSSARVAGCLRLRVQSFAGVCGR
jgi:hypothetical protein